MSWLNDLKKGDEVIVRSRHRDHLCIVDRTTKCHIFIGQFMYKITNGERVPFEAYYGTSLIMANNKNKKAIYMARRLVILRSRLRAETVHKLSMEKLERIIKIVKE